jgi:hypothetical protein
MLKLREASTETGLADCQHLLALATTPVQFPKIRLDEAKPAMHTGWTICSSCVKQAQKLAYVQADCQHLLALATTPVQFPKKRLDEAKPAMHTGWSMPNQGGT